MKVIQLDLDDDIVSVCDRLTWSGERRVLLTMPEDASGVLDGLALIRLRRFVDRHRLDVGLVTSDVQMSRRAKALGLPAFSSVDEGRENRRGWWRWRKRRERVGLPAAGIGDLMLPNEEVTGDEERQPISARHWMVRYVAILLFIAAVAFLIIAIAFALPRATIGIRPEVLPLSSTELIIADPGTEAVDYENSLIPARLLETIQVWQGEVETTGTTAIPVGSARGQVVFMNLTEEELVVPSGTLLGTGDGNYAFQTVTPLTMIGVISSTAEIDVVALEPGPHANVDAGAIDSFDGPLAGQLLVSNPAPLTGGDVRVVQAVTDWDLERLYSQVLQFLQAVSIAEMETKLTEREFLARESLRVVRIVRETYSHVNGEQTDTVRLKVEAVLQGTAVDMTQTTGLVYETLSEHVPPGYVLYADSIVSTQNEILEIDKDGRVIFTVASEGVVAADIDLETQVDAIAGQAPELAIAHLYETLPLREVPSIDVWPTWFKRVPYLRSRIETQILTDE
jgi:hypothetical protein